MTIRLIAGLGNPGAGYSETRHNAGFWFVDALAARGLGAGPASWSSEGRFKGHAAKVAAPGLAAGGLWLLKPDTFMNRSGASVQPMCHFYQIATEEILVVHDELDLPPGQIRLKQGGGHGGHNGIRDIAATLGDANFWRLRLGIGHPHEILENRWYLSEQKGTDVGLEFAADNYVEEILPHRRDSGVDLIAQ